MDHYCIQQKGTRNKDAYQFLYLRILHVVTDGKVIVFLKETWSIAQMTARAYNHNQSDESSKRKGYI